MAAHPCGERIGLVRIPAEKINEVRDRLDIERIVGRTVKLKRKGQALMGCCPFHQEKTPSFSVDARKKLFHCFGCGVGGDIFAFVMRQENMDFIEAVRWLASEAGVVLPEKEESPAEQTLRLEKERMYQANQVSRTHFEAELAKNADALGYLREQRQLSDEIIRDFHLGYAPDSWDRLSSQLDRNKVPEKISIQLGLLGRKTHGNGVYDRYRGKVMFPIALPSGDIAGFGARRSDWLNQEEPGPKYLNSIDSKIYDKSRVFYGLDRAKSPIRRQRRAILVEGYFDVIALHQAGIETAIACCGTSISKVHAQTLAKLADEVITAYDGDEAGQRATRRAAEILLQTGLKVRVLQLPESDDPDTFVGREGKQALLDRLDQSPSAIDTYLEQAMREHQGGGIAGLVEIVNSIRPLLLAIANPADRDLYVQGVAQRLGIDARRLAARLRQAPSSSRGQRPKERQQEPPPSTETPQIAQDMNSPDAAQTRQAQPVPVAEQTILRLLVNNPVSVLEQLEASSVIEAIQHDGIKAAIERARQLGPHFDAHHALDTASTLCHPQEITQIRQGLMTQLPNEDDLSPCIDQVLRKHHRERLAVLKKRIAQESNPDLVKALMSEAEGIRLASQATGRKFNHAK